MSESADGNADLQSLRTIAAYQFGGGAGEALFPPTESLSIKRTTSGRPQQVHAETGRIVSFGIDGRFTLGIEGGRRLTTALAHPAYRVVVVVVLGRDGRFTLGIEGGRRLTTALAHPAYRVVVDDESEPFVREGKNVFSKFVLEAGEEIRPGDEVLVVHERGELLAVGRAELDGAAIGDFETGMAVSVREGVPIDT